MAGRYLTAAQADRQNVNPEVREDRVREVVRAAADLLEKQGWTAKPDGPDFPKPPDAPMNVFRAVHMAATGNRYGPPNAYCAMGRAAVGLEIHIRAGLYYDGRDYLWDWQQGEFPIPAPRDAAEAAEVLRAAADHYRHDRMPPLAGEPGGFAEPEWKRCAREAWNRAHPPGRRP